MSGLVEVAPPDWDDLLVRLELDDVYFRRSYLESAELLGQGRPTFLHLADPGGDVLFPCLVRDAEDGYGDIGSPMGYGGPAAAGETPPVHAFLDAYESWCSENRIVATFVRFHPVFANQCLAAERWHVEQIVFPTMQEAEAAAARLKDGMSFAALAAERGLKDRDIDLGSVSKSEIVDPAVANAAFALKDGEVSTPVQGRFGAVIVSVSRIEPEVGKSLAEVTEQIRQQIATERAKAEVRSLHEKIEEARAGGDTLQQIAEKLKLPVGTYDVDRSGREPSGKVTDIPHAGQVIPAAFNSDVGVDNDPIDVEGGYLWYNVAGITPARDRTLDEVKDQVETRWRDDEIAARLKAKSAELLDKLKAGTPLDAVAASAGVKVQTAEKLTRTKPEPGLPSRVLAAVFRTAKDAFGSSEGDQPTDWVVFRVTDITTPKFDAASPEMKRITELLKKQESDEILEQYLAWLQNDLGTSVNQAALTQALSNSSSDTN